MIKKKIAIDCRMYGMSGIGRYIETLISQIISNTNSEFEFILIGKKKLLEKYKEDKNITKIINLDIKPFSFKEILKGIGIFHNISKEVEFIHFTHINIPLLVPKNSVITIHDLILLHKESKSNMLKSWYLKNILRVNKKRFKNVITVSEYSKKDICRILKYEENKVHVVYEAPADIFTTKLLDSSNVRLESTKYFLYVGNRRPHKNLSTAIEVMDKVFDKHKEFKFIIIGKKFKKNDDVDLCIQKIKNKDNFIILENVNDTLLVEYYRNSFAFVFLSLFEGFGLPPLEAFAFGVPCIGSNRTSIPEVVKDGGILVDPFNKEEIEKAILHLIESDELYINLRSKALERYRYFSNYGSVDRINEVYNSSN